MLLPPENIRSRNRKMVGIRNFGVHLKIYCFKMLAEELVIDPEERKLAVISCPETVAGGSKSIVEQTI